MLLTAASLTAQAPPGPPAKPDNAAPVGASANDNAAPRAQFAELVFDFGTVKSGDKPTHDFVVTNAGTLPLEIREVKGGCGCTVIGAFDKQIQPGKTGKIPIEFNPLNFAGPVSKAITVTSNDPKQGTCLLQIKAHVWRPIEVTPTYVHFMAIEGEAVKETKVVRLVSNIDEPVTIEPPLVAAPNLTTELKTIRPGKEYELHVTYDPPQAVPEPAMGPLRPVPAQQPGGMLMLKTTCAAMPSVNVSTFVLSLPAVQASPQQLILPVGPLGREQRHVITVRSGGARAIKLLEASVNYAGVRVETQEIHVGRIFQLTIVLPPDFVAPTPCELTIRTDHPKYGVVSVPINHAKPPTAQPVAQPPGPGNPH